MAESTNTASGAGRKHVPRPQGFRVAPGVKVTAAATERDKHWDPAPRIRDLVSGSRQRAGHTVTTLLDLLEMFDTLNGRDETRMPLSNRDLTQLNNAEARICKLLAKTEPASNEEAVRLFEYMERRCRREVIMSQDIGKSMWEAFMAAHAYLVLHSKKPHELRTVDVTVGADDALISACADYRARMDEVNNGPEETLDGYGPIWQQYAACRDTISNALPVTIAGLVAKARAAKIEARRQDGSERPENTMAAAWSWDLVNDLIRLFGGEETPAMPACPAAALIPDILEIEATYEIIANHVPGLSNLADAVNDHMDAQYWARRDALLAILQTTRPSSVHGAMLCMLGAVVHIDDLDLFEYSAKEVGEKAEAARNLIAGAYYALQAIYGECGLAKLRDERIGLYRYSLATREEYEAEQRRIEGMR
jgi:hypothetical protein